MASLPNAGIPGPIPDTFDFTGRMQPPPQIEPAGFALRIRNEENVIAEKHNEDSIRLTKLCVKDRANHPDVGPALQALYGYTNEELDDMINAETYCAAVGPLPIFIRLHVERRRSLRQQQVEKEKADKEKQKNHIPKLSVDWGTDLKPSCLSPLKWQQALLNYDSALDILSGPAQACQVSFGGEFKKHRDFVIGLPYFEDTYPDWYPFERESSRNFERFHI
ncbi:hypothetical protein B0H10DRAFT_2189150 [Mycena sp. CBHHK59/15]|nr:hypothetical protein B0H10DRAFT_2189150 [Mycena sp. CBHHK59/15]